MPGFISSPNRTRPMICMAAAGVASAVIAAPFATAEPALPMAGSESASATVNDLQSQGMVNVYVDVLCPNAK